MWIDKSGIRLSDNELNILFNPFYSVDFLRG